MKLLTIISASLALAGFTTATPPPQTFSIKAKGNPKVPSARFDASRSNIFLNYGDSGAVCEVKPGCPKPKDAVFYLKDSILYLYTGSSNPVQKVFLDRSGFGQGKIGYLTGDGQLPSRWEVQGWTIDGAGNLKFKGKGLIACPTSDPKIKSWTVWADLGIATPGGNKGCLPFTAHTMKTKPVACKYT
ncbi:cell wall protein PhiA [Trichophyton verrucosum HKI 0517]|uniref:Cell wall protein PhiA n=1 Tax=Trichophyton verrucosum (strain HKI 0517) TaxID=663202 RepID=D4D1H9_TRIVH|nr:cell wall protein PhiA [Trichophyton verrucosum HKI 0517]EFE44313.1 cell wall protein PhiA [Trichophyton verrucosum HKI 0517]